MIVSNFLFVSRNGRYYIKNIITIKDTFYIERDLSWNAIKMVEVKLWRRVPQKIFVTRSDLSAPLPLVFPATAVGN